MTFLSVFLQLIQDSNTTFELKIEQLKTTPNAPNEHINELQIKLKDTQETTHYTSLAKSLLCRIILYNFRRSGEASRMKLSDFKDAIDANDDALDFLYEKETASAAKYIKQINIIGKRGRPVPVLLKTMWVECIQLLNKSRKHCGVSDKNKFVFAAPKGESYIRGSDAIRYVRDLVDEKETLLNKNLLTSTKLRKYFSTCCQTMSLEGRDRQNITDHMGHSIEVSDNFYRMKAPIIEKTVVRPLLDAIEGGVSMIRGRALRDLKKKTG